MWKVKHERTADCVVAGFRCTRTARASARCCSASSTTRARSTTSAWPAASPRPGASELVDELAPLQERRARRPPVARVGRGRRRTRTGRMPGGQSRWNAQKDLSWEPLRTELVAEVRYEHVLAGRFRHGGRLVRFRPDRTPESCTYAPARGGRPRRARRHLPGGLAHRAQQGGVDRPRRGGHRGLGVEPRQGVLHPARGDEARPRRLLPRRRRAAAAHAPRPAAAARALPGRRRAGKSFFQKRVPKSAPDWLTDHRGGHAERHHQRRARRRRPRPPPLGA